MSSASGFMTPIQADPVAMRSNSNCAEHSISWREPVSPSVILHAGDVGTWSVRGRYVVGTWSVRGRYVVGTWSVRGRYVVGTWRVTLDDVDQESEHSSQLCLITSNSK
jgi:hypothetical protein